MEYESIDKSKKQKIKVLIVSNIENTEITKKEKIEKLYNDIEFWLNKILQVSVISLKDLVKYFPVSYNFGPGIPKEKIVLRYG